MCLVDQAFYKTVVLLEPTVPWVGKMLEVSERKREKYAELVEECWNQVGMCKAWALSSEEGALKEGL